MKLEKLEDVLEVDVDNLKVADAKRLIHKIKSFVKVTDIQNEVKAEEAKELPYLAVSAVGNKMYTLRFDPETKEARVIDEKEFSQGGHMSYHAAEKFMYDKIHSQTKRNHK